MTVDLRRTCRIRIVEDIDAPDARPGDVAPMRATAGRDAMPWGLAFRCPGCGAASCLFLERSAGTPGHVDHPVWTVTGGDPRTALVSLSPSIHHATALGGCGWHGYLRAGQLIPC